MQTSPESLLSVQSGSKIAQTPKTLDLDAVGIIGALKFISDNGIPLLVMERVVYFSAYL